MRSRYRYPAFPVDLDSSVPGSRCFRGAAPRLKGAPPSWSAATHGWLGSCALVGLVASCGAVAFAASPEDLPRLTFEDFRYEGAFRLPADTYGESSLNYSEGPIAYNPDNHSLFLVGHSHQQALAEFAIPSLVLSSRLSDLEMASSPLQAFSSVLERTTGGNPEALDRIGGMAWLSSATGSQLLVNAYEYYDAPADNSETTQCIRDASDLAGSGIDGYFTFDGGAGHTSGWISSIPEEWRLLLGGTHITGQSSGLPIIGRLSVGPSAFAFDADDIIGEGPVPEPVPTVTLLDFSLAHPLSDDLSNESGENSLWTHLSRVVYGFIVPGSRTYVTLGHSGGHVSGVCYKCIQLDGHECGGYCPPDPNDLYLYYWLWDVNDLVAVKTGALAPYAVRPYEYGEVPAVFPATELGGGSFDPVTGLLYLTLQRADTEQGTYSNPPVVAAYSFSPVSTGAGDEALSSNQIPARALPNPALGSVRIRYEIREPGPVQLAVFGTSGRLVRRLLDRPMPRGEHLATWDLRDGSGLRVPPGTYFYRIRTEDGVVGDKLIVGP